MKKLLCAVALSTTLSANAEVLSGHMLLDALQSEQAGMNLYALGFVVGVFDATHNTTQCAPSTTTVRAIKDVALMTLREIPQHRHLPAQMIIRTAFETLWPCGKRI